MNEVCVRVAARVRPLLPREVLHRHQVCVRVVPGSAQLMLGSDRLFNFDHAFGPSASQDEVYGSCVRPLVQSVVDGYNATVFCYGQTGSGKTYTLGGRKDEDGGVVDRVVCDLFSLLEEKKTGGDGADVAVRVSYIEVYREELRDLLEIPNIHKELHIREDERGTTVVVGAKEVIITSAEELLSILEMGNAVRQTNATGMNEHSSRSHAILTFHINVCHHNENSGSAFKSLRCSKLCLVDLAGSERAGKTGNSGTRLKESAHINTGLLALGNVIRALSEQSRNRRGNSCGPHIPYRDAKITRLLRDSLGGTAHTLMVACVSPSHHFVAETLSVLQFASKARNIRNFPGASPVQKDFKLSPTTWHPREARMAELEYELETLRELLKEKESHFKIEREKAEGGNPEEGNSQHPKPTSVCDKDTKGGQEQLSQYRDLAQEAAVLLTNISDPVSNSLRQRLQDWQRRMSAVSQSHHTDDEEGYSMECGEQRQQVKVLELREELRNCQDALRINEQLLQQKDAELRRLRKEVEKLLQASEEDQSRLRMQTEELVNQQVVIDHLRNDLMTFRGESIGEPEEAEASGYLEKRCHSVPLFRLSSVNRPLRKIHSSPSAYSLERVMAAFKMRGHLLLAEMEEKEKVYSPFLKQRPESKQRNREEEEEDDEELMGKSKFRRSLNRTWTGQQKKRASQHRTVQTCDGNSVMTHPYQSTDKNGHQPIQSNIKINTSVTKRLIRDLSVNMHLKEELIRDLNRTDKETKALTKLSVPTGVGRENVLARLSEQSQQTRGEVYFSLQQMRLQRKQLQTSLGPLNEKREVTEMLYQNESAKDSSVSNSHSEKSQRKLYEGSWLEEEEEAVLQKRIELEELEAELKRREEVLQRREACLQQKKHLEIKMLSSSQTLSRDMLRVSMELENVEEQLHNSSQQKTSGGVTIRELEKERELLKQQRDILDDQLRNNKVLTVEERHSLFQLEEAIEALEAALEFKNHSIQAKRKKLSISQSALYQSRCAEPAQLCDVIRKLAGLSQAEALEMLVKYFNKVVYLREVKRNLNLRCKELELNAEEQESMLKEMEAAMQRLALDTDRRLTQQQRDHQNSLQLLLQNVTGEDGDGIHNRLQHLEKELFFYKSTSRQLKQKLREVVKDAIHPQNHNSHTPEQRDTQSSHTSSSENKNTSESAPARTHIATTYTKIHAVHEDELAHSESSGYTRQTHSSSSSPAPRKAKISEENQTESLPPGFYARSPVEKSEPMTPVRLCRRELRQISVSDLQRCTSASRRRQSLVNTSTDTILEDSIEVSRNTHE